MSRHFLRSAAYWLFAALCLGCVSAHAEPYLAVQTGFKCGQCHVNPTGGGMRNAFGDVFAQTQLPANHVDTGADTWAGAINRFLSVGGDLRAQAIYTEVPHTSSSDSFDLEQARVYINATVIPDRLGVYVDELVAPGGALNREAYVSYWTADHHWYFKGGQMYLPYGLRLEDQTAFIRTAPGINMDTPDKGLEVGWEHGPWDAQLAVSNGTAGGPEVDHGKQYSFNLAHVQSIWRVGVAANLNSAAAGDKTSFGLFGGLRTGPIVWLGEADVIDDKSFPTDSGKMWAGLLEADWLIRRGHNLKVTAEYADPNRNVPNDAQTRWSLVYEYTPIQFVQIRAGFRYGDGIPQLPIQHTRVGFLELHGFF
jgi:hypothetical protein